MGFEMVLGEKYGKDVYQKSKDIRKYNSLSITQISDIVKVLPNYVRLSYTKKREGYLRLLNNVPVVPTQ